MPIHFSLLRIRICINSVGQKVNLFIVAITLSTLYVECYLVEVNSSYVARKSNTATFSCSKHSGSSENSYEPHMLKNYTSLATFLSLTAKAHVHSVAHGQTRKPQHTSSVPSAKPTLSGIGHSRSFKVILISTSRNSVVVTHNNIGFISETDEDYSNGKKALWLHPLHSSLMAVLRENV